MEKSNLRHAGIYNFKADVSVPEQQSFFISLKSLENISGVQKMELSKQVSSKNTYEYGFSMEFADADAMKAYLNHPSHEEFVQNYWLKYVDDFIEIDTQPMEILGSIQ